MLPICGQDVTFFDTKGALTLDWQEQILEQVDPDDLGEVAYSELLDELSELVVWSDTLTQGIHEGRWRQNIIWSSNRCLSPRAGYLNQDDEHRERNKAYLGDPWHHSLRYKIRKGRHWQAGLSVEKDAGEAWRSTFPIFDSWHAFVRLSDVTVNQVRLADAVVGDYRLRMGCGLLVNQGFSLGKQYLSQQLMNQRSNRISPFASNAEAEYMRGVAVDLRLGNHFSLLPYLSVHPIDGTYHADTHHLSALQTDGYHRTKTEESHRDASWQTIVGSRLGYQGEWFDVGMHITYTQLQYDYYRNPLYYNTHYFRGYELAQASVDYTLRFGGAIVKGECALDDGGAFAQLTALQYKWNDSWTTGLVYRYYGDRYRQLHASALGENKELQGEQGLTLNIEGQIARHWQLSGMFDYFLHNQPQFGIKAEHSQGFDTSLRALYSRRKGSASLSYRLKHKGETFRHSLDGIITWRPTKEWSMKSQLRTRLYNKREEAVVSNNFGYAFAQSVVWNCRRWASCPFVLEGQACYFRTDDYDSRIYLTERPILYGFGLPMLFGEGLRYSLTGTIKIGPQINVDLKWALTNYAGQSRISSGLQEIRGNNQQDLWLQLRLKL